MTEMSPELRYGYVTGIVEGLAFSRQLDGDTDGMTCLYNWLYGDTERTFTRIYQAFERFGDRLPATIIHALAKRDCEDG